MMKNKKVEANLSMVVSKTFSGLNMNALKYLLPVWVSPLSGVTLRCVFAAIAFWIIGMFVKPEISTRKEKIFLFLLGALGIYGFMFLYLMGLSKTTSVFGYLPPDRQHRRSNSTGRAYCLSGHPKPDRHSSEPECKEWLRRVRGRYRLSSSH